VSKSIKLPIILIGIILVILVGNHFFGNTDNLTEYEEVSDVDSPSDIEHPNIDVKEALFRVELEEDYYFNKHLNFFLMSFFRMVNEKNLDMQIMNKEYVEFMRLNEDKILSSYDFLENASYDITGYKNLSTSYIVDLSYRDIGSDTRYQRSFSIIDNTLADRPFIKVEEIGIKTERDDYSINLVSKGVFDKYEIYKIEIENRSDRELIVDDSMYGFNAIKGDNKYYHTLESAKLPYEIVPGEIRSFLIRFDVLNPKEISVVIDGEEVRLY